MKQHFSVKPYHQNTPGRIVVAVGLPIILSLFQIPPVLAAEMSSDRYVIQTGVLRFGSPPIVLPSPSPSPSAIGRAVPQPKVVEPFSLTLSKKNLAFDNLTPMDFQKEEVTLTVNHDSISGYTVWIIEDRPPTHASGTTFIPDTACDIKKKCTLNESAPWTKTSIFGFGYSLDQNLFRPLPNNAKGEAPIAIMSGSTKGETSTISATFVANIAPDQPKSGYTNTIQFIALPAY